MLQTWDLIRKVWILWKKLIYDFRIQLKNSQSLAESWTNWYVLNHLYFTIPFMKLWIFYRLVMFRWQNGKNNTNSSQILPTQIFNVLLYILTRFVFAISALSPDIERASCFAARFIMKTVELCGINITKIPYEYM